MRSSDMNNGGNNDNCYQGQSDINLRRSTCSAFTNRKKRPLQLMLDATHCQSKDAAAAASAGEQLLSRKYQPPPVVAAASVDAALPSPTNQNMMQSSNIILALLSNNDIVSTTTTTTTPPLPMSEMIIAVGHGGAKRGYEDCDNSIKAEEDEVGEEEFSPLTCPASQPEWGRRGSYNRNEDVKVREERGEKTHSCDHYFKMDNPLPSADVRLYLSDPIKNNDDEDDNDDDDEETRREEVNANAKGMEGSKQLQPPTGKGGVSPGLAWDYEKGVLKGCRLDSMPEDENCHEAPEGQHPHLWEETKLKPTWKTTRHDEVHAIGARPPLPSSLSLNAAIAASAPVKLRIIRKCREEVPVLALSAENEANNEEVDEEVDEDAEATKQQQQLQRGTKHKVAETKISALAKSDKTGEIDSFICNSKAAEERKQRLSALATCCMDDEQKLQGRCNLNYGKEAVVGVDEALGDLSCESDEKQSQPLLSAAISGDAVTMPAHSSMSFEGDAAIAAHASTTISTTSSINEIICAVRHEFDKMGKVLLFPICQSTLKNAIILPCVHSLCRACFKDLYNPPSVKPAKKMNKKYTVSSPPTPKEECLVCKTPYPGKCNVKAAPNLDELARAYKLMGRSFSFAPIKYTENVLMTHLEPDKDGSVGTEHDHTEESKEQQLQVAKVVLSAFVEQTEIHQSTAEHADTTSRPVPSLEDKMKLHLYEQTANEQEAVVRADEQVLSNVARRGRLIRGMKRIVNAVKIVFVGKTEETSTNALLARIEEFNTSAMEEVDAVVEASSTAVKSVQISGYEPNGDNPNLLGKETSKAIIRADDIQNEDTTSGGDGFFSALEDIRDESQSKHSTAKEDMQSSLSFQSPTIINDGNTLQKAPGPESCTLPTTKASLRGSYVCNLERNPDVLRQARVAFGRFDTARSSPRVFHDGNTVRKLCNETELNHGLSFRSTDFDETSKSENFLPLASAAVEGQMSDIHTCEDKPHATENFTVGSIVFAQTRTLPGIHKPGGLACVTKMYPSAGNGNSTNFDIAYVLDGREKRVDESFVTFNVNELTTAEECPDDSIVTQGCKSYEKKLKQRRTVVTSEPVVPSFPIYHDEEVTHIPKYGLKWAGIRPTKKKENMQKQQHQQQTTKAPMKKAARTMKRVLLPSNAMPKFLQMKKRRHIVDAKDDVKSSNSNDKSNTIPTLKEVLSSLSIDEIVSRADSRYNALLSSLDKQSTSDPHVTLHAVTSSLSESDSKLLDSFRQFLKGKPVVLKLMKFFNPTKTQICITSASSRSYQSSGPIDVVSSYRTLKVMQSSLNGIPILTPAWMEACMKEGHLVPPTGTMCIRSLPRKPATIYLERCLEDSNEQFGVAKYAAAFKEMELSSTRHVLSGISVLLCGRSAESGMMKDLKVLLKQAGASVLGSESMASRQLTNISEGTLGDPIVFLCGDSPMDESFGISDALFKQTEQLLKGTSSASVHCVTSSWLFDSISCAAPMKTSAYEPAAPRARTLWKLATTRQDDMTRT